MNEPVRKTSPAEALAYWGPLFEGIQPQQGLPQDRRVSPSRIAKPFQLDRILDANLASKLNRLANSVDSTLHELLLSAFAGLLFRYTETGEILIAWQMQEAPPTVLPVRFSLAADQTFLQLLERTRSACSGASLHGCVPVEMVSAFLHDSRQSRYDDFFPIRFWAPERDASASPPEIDLAGELTLCVDAIPGAAIRARFFCNAERYQSGFIEAMASHYSQLLESAAANPSAMLADLDMATPEEQKRLRVWSFGPAASRVPNLYHVQFQEHVDRNPDKQAVVYPGGALPYAELNFRANQMAHHLQGLGAGPGATVVIGMRRSPELVITYLGAIKAGATIFLLDTRMPAERIGSVLEAISPAVVLTQSPLNQNLAGLVWPVVCYDEIVAQLANQEKTAPINHITVDDTAFLIVTSGSTGKPKIIKTPFGHHRSGVGYERPELPPPSPDDRHLLKTDSGTAFTHAEILRALTTGGTLFIAPEGLEYDLSRLAAFIGEHRISCLLATPSQLTALLADETIENCGSLRVVECVGEVIPPELKERFFRKLRHSNLVISYGCSEAPSATGRVCLPVDDDPAIVDVGQPAPLMEVFVLDSRLRMSPIGVPGELYLGGELASGYLNDPAGTAERFVEHLFSGAPGTRLFRTGDLGRWLPSGNLEILRRRDSQVKVRGFRIELGEIETRLADYSSVSRCAVVVWEDQRGEKHLVAYWVPQGKATATSSALRGHLRARLPAYMVPSFFVRLDSMPLTPNGKLDRKALPAPDDSRPDLDTPYVAPSTPIEKVLAGIWCEILGLKEVGIHDNFFELGGHSLLATQVVSRLREVFEVEISVRSHFDCPTIAGLAVQIVQSQSEVTDPDELALLLAELEEVEDGRDE